jgi:hypothetical protein
MAHFAKLDENNIVLEVNVVNNSDIGDLPFPESEALGVEFLNTFYGDLAVWKQTSYNGNFRKNYAGVGYTYDAVRDAFISQKPYDSWLLIEETCLWEPLVAYPSDGKNYYWDESTLNWVEVTE